MRRLIDLFNGFWDKRSRDIIIGCIGRVESFDNKKMRADVQPLLEYAASGESSATKFAVIGDMPVQFLLAGGYYIRPDYAKGDLVWVSYATFSIERGLSNTFDNISGSVFSRENASVSHGIAAENWSAPAAFNDPGLLIGHKDGTFIHATPDEIKIKDKNGNEIKMNSGGINFADKNGNILSLKQDGITLNSGDSAPWRPNTVQACMFTGAPHGGQGSGIMKLKGS